VASTRATPDLPLPGRGVGSGRPTPPEDEVRDRPDPGEAQVESDECGPAPVCGPDLACRSALYALAMGYICPACGEGLPEDQECTCTTSGDNVIRAVPKRRQARRRKFAVAERIEIGERDEWLCGICQDPTHLVERPSVVSLGEITVEEINSYVLLEEGWPEGWPDQAFALRWHEALA